MLDLHLSMIQHRSQTQASFYDQVCDTVMANFNLYKKTFVLGACSLLPHFNRRRPFSYMHCNCLLIYNDLFLARTLKLQVRSLLLKSP